MTRTNSKDAVVTMEVTKKEGTQPSTFMGSGGTEMAAGSGATGTEQDKSNGGDPVRVRTGEVVEFSEDVRLPLPDGTHLELWRRYSSAWSTERLPFGRGWTHSLNQWIEASELGFRLRDADGDWIALGQVADGETAFLRGIRTELRRQGRRFELFREASGQTLVFTPLTAEGPARLASIHRRQGLLARLNYEGERLVSVELPPPGGGPTRRSLHFEWDQGAERVQRVSLRVDGQTLATRAYEYSAPDAMGLLTAATDPYGETKRYAYDGSNRLSTVTFPSGAAFEHVYDDAGQCVETWGPDQAHHWRFDRTRLGTDGEVVATGAEQARRYRFNPDGQLLEESTFDGQGVRLLERDADGLVLREVNGAGEAVTREYDERGELEAETDAAGNVTSYVPTSEGYVVVLPDGTEEAVTLDEFGELVKVAWSDGDERRYERNGQGHIEGVYAPDGLLALYQLDTEGRPVKARDARGLEREFRWDALGYAAGSRDSLGRVHLQTHDVFGRLLSEQLADGSRREKAYFNDGRTAREVDELGREKRYERAGTGVIVSEFRPGPWGPERWGFEYDKTEQPRAVVNPGGERWEIRRDWAGQVVEERSWDGRTRALRYDAAGRVVRIEEDGGRWSAYDYDPLGNLLREESPHGLATFDRDTLGRLEQAKLNDGPEQLTVEVERDAYGRVVRELQNGFELEWEYDVRGRVASRTVLGERTEYRYDAGGALVALVHLGQPVELQRDLAGRLVRTVAFSGRVAVDQRFDVRDRLTDVRLVLPDGPQSSAPFLTDCGSLAAEPVTLSPGWRVGAQRRFHWDAASRLLGVEDRTWGVTRYEHDKADRLTGAFRGVYAERFEYQATGNLEGLSRTLHGQEAPARPVNGSALLPFPAVDPLRSSSPPSFGGGGSLRTIGSPTLQVLRAGGAVERWGPRQYETDTWGRRTAKTTVEGTTRYHWDDRNRLREVELQDGRRIRHFYDAFGRRIRTDRHVAPDPNALAKLAEQLETAATQTPELPLPVGWDAPEAESSTVRLPLESVLTEGEALPVPAALAPATKAFEQRIPASDSEQEAPVEDDLELRTWYLWDDDELCGEEELDYRTGERKQRVYVADRCGLPDEAEDDADPQLYRPLLQCEHGELLLVLTDTRGAPTELVDAAGRVAWSAAYGAHGEVVEEWCHPGRARTVRSPFRLLGQYADTETGLECTRWRWWDAESGRWLSPDPLGIDGGVTLYGWDGSPVLRADALGLACTGAANTTAASAKGAGGPPSVAGKSGGAKKGRGNRQTADERRQARLQRMSPEQLKKHCERRAQKLNEQLRKKDETSNARRHKKWLAQPEPRKPPEFKPRNFNESSTTVAVGVVEDKSGKRTVVVTSSKDRGGSPVKLAPGEKYRPEKVTPEKRPAPGGKPELVRRREPVVTKNKKGEKTTKWVPTKDGGHSEPIRDKNGKITGYKDYDKADTSELRKNPNAPGSTDHHAEQRLANSAKQSDEKVVAMAPSKPCCPGCHDSLKNSGDLGAVPEGLQGSPPPK